MNHPPGGDGQGGTFSDATLSKNNVEYTHDQIVNYSKLMDTQSYENTALGDKHLTDKTDLQKKVPLAEKIIKTFNQSQDKYDSNSIYVFIERIGEQANLGKLHPLRVAHILRKKLDIKNIVDIKTIGKNRVKVIFTNIKDANAVVTNKNLEIENLKAFIPNHLLEKKGLVRGVDTYFEDDYILDNIESPVLVKSIKRRMKKVEDEGQIKFVKRQHILISFEGNLIPPEIRIDCVVFPVEIFYGTVTQCFKCYRYGHISKQCRSTVNICRNCTKPNEENHVCTKDDSYCIHCKVLGHPSSSKKCPSFEKQKRIKKIMIDNNLTFIEAKEFCETSFSGVSIQNRFSALSENNFPQLNGKNTSLSQPTRRNKPNPTYFSQPSTSSSYNTVTSNNPAQKKRKYQSSSPIEPMFPFTFGPPTPLPPNPKNLNTSAEDENCKLVEYISKFVFNYIQQQKTPEELKKLNFNFVKNEMAQIIGKSLPYKK